MSIKFEEILSLDSISSCSIRAAEVKVEAVGLAMEHIAYGWATCWEDSLCSYVTKIHLLWCLIANQLAPLQLPAYVPLMTQWITSLSHGMMFELCHNYLAVWYHSLSFEKLGYDCPPYLDLRRVVCPNFDYCHCLCDWYSLTSWHLDWD